MFEVQTTSSVLYYYTYDIIWWSQSNLYFLRSCVRKRFSMASIKIRYFHTNQPMNEIFIMIQK